MIDVKFAERLETVVNTMGQLIEENRQLRLAQEKYQLLTIEEVAALLKVEKRYAYKFIKDAKLRAFKTGSKITRYYKSDILNLIDKNTE